MNNSIEITNLTKNYKGFALDNLNLNVPTGTIMGFIGENGAGKSTTIKLIMDIIKRNSGEVKIFGQDNLTLSKELKEQIGVVLDECCFPENLKIPSIKKIMQNMFSNWEKDTFDKYLTKFNLPLNKTVKDFSKGMKMKLSIAVALSHNAKLLILDEATGGLDPIIRDEILDIFLEFIQDETHSILISSHIISDLEKICDYISFVNKGKLVFSMSKDDLLQNFAMLKCSEDDFNKLPESAIIGCRKNSFGVEVLVIRNKVSSDLPLEIPTIEEIMLYHEKGDK